MASEGSSLDLVPVWRVIPETNPDEGAIVLMRDGSFRMLIRAGSVNFDMKSPAEQDGITYSFGEMLNSLSPDFPIQIVVHTKHLDTDTYMRQFERRRRDPAVPEQIRALIEDHVSHFAGQVSSRNLLQREYYIVIPHNVEADPVGERNSDSIPLLGLFKAVFSAAEDRLARTPTEGDLDEARQQLEIRAHQVQSYMGRIDIPTRRLGELEVRNLLYEFFNPDLATRQKLRVPTGGEEMFPRLRLEGRAAEQRRRLEAPERPALEPVREPAPRTQPPRQAPRRTAEAPPPTARRRRVPSPQEEPQSTAIPAIPLSPEASEQRRRRAQGSGQAPAEQRRRRVAGEEAPPPLN